MKKQPNVPFNSPKKPSKLLALIALAFAFSLPFILVKTFPHKNKTFIDNIPLTLPAIPEQEEAYDDSETSSETPESSDSTNASQANDSTDSNDSSKTSDTLQSQGSKGIEQKITAAKESANKAAH